MKITADDVLKVVQDLGPVVPNKIKQRLGQPDSTLINVYLGELKNDGKIRMTALKLGSSKFAYVPEQLPKIAALTEHLNEKDRRTAAKLREEGVIRAATADPLTRVSLSNIPDFARPITVKTGQGEETFYRWFLFASEDAQAKIKQVMGVKPSQQTPNAEQKASAEEPAQQPASDSPEAKEKSEGARVKDTPKPQPKQETQEEFEKPAQKKLIDVEPESAFGKKLLAYFESKNILLRDYHETRKDKEIDCVLEIPSAVGSMTYYCKAKNKKNSNDGDLAAAILQGKKRMLPAIYITTGSITKKALTAPELQEVQVVELGSTS